MVSMSTTSLHENRLSRAKDDLDEWGRQLIANFSDVVPGRKSHSIISGGVTIHVLHACQGLPMQVVWCTIGIGEQGRAVCSCSSSLHEISRRSRAGAQVGCPTWAVVLRGELVAGCHARLAKGPRQ